MATTTRDTIQQIVAEEFGDYFLGESSAAGSTTTMVDVTAIDLPNGDDDDAFIGWYLKITESGHCAEGEVRRCTDYTAATGTFTVATARAFSATTGSGTAWELYRYNPDDYIVAIQRAVAWCYPALYRHVIDESIVVDGLLTNDSFETFASTFTGWTNVGTPTVTAETSIKFHGDQAAKVVAGGSDGQMTQDLNVNVSTLTSESISFRCWVYATAASTARIRIDFGVSTSSSDYHSGVDQWELLTLDATDVPAGATQVKIILETVSLGTAYFDDARAWCRPIYRYNIPSTIVEWPSFVSIQWDRNDPGGLYYPIVSLPTPGSRIRIEGQGALTSPSAGSTAIQVEEPRVELITSSALYYINRIIWSQTSTQDRGRFKEGMALFAEDRKELRAQHSMPAMGAEIGPRGQSADPQWHIESSDNTKVLVLDRSRGTTDRI